MRLDPAGSRADAAAPFASLNQRTHIKVQKGMQNEITAKLTNAKAALATFLTEAHCGIDGLSRRVPSPGG